MPKFIKFLIVINVVLWLLWGYIILSSNPSSYKNIFLFLFILFFALSLTISFPISYIHHKRLPNFTSPRILYRQGLKWGMFFSFGVVGLAFLKALNLINFLNAGLFILLYVGIFFQIRGKK